MRIPEDNLETTRDTSPIHVPMIAGAQGLLFIVFEKQENTANWVMASQMFSLIS